ncbi:hypothetical protein ONS87_10750 [Caldimonas thermodepolymerans]|jgi:hypothetical protein|uniref:Translesion DNA synthesis-associated protein ImuA n=2 Tax=Caldimonas thermodepolymerans TaxID=215580 RepID=A0AA46HXR6_9BURK|nr:hypothetical protein [Caldimonas thermodepolymerans]TCP10072.1 hypothetical protein EV676_101656 [Caldimonas thermodepolymerans]UZG46451.1 hypothetical protein ONS87_10750 [Caldimonas thermodepolymerans]
MAHAPCAPEHDAFRLPPVMSFRPAALPHRPWRPAPATCLAARDPAARDAANDAAPTAGSPWWKRWSQALAWLEPAGPAPGTWTSGFPMLDAALPGGGWPCHGLVEVLAPRPGHPEFALLAPALAGAAARQQRFGAIGAPVGGVGLAAIGGFESTGLPAWGDAEPGDAATGTPTASVLQDALHWLQQGSEGVLVVWLPEMGMTQLRALKRAARRRRTLVFVVRPWVANWDDSEADLRLCLIAGKGGQWEVRVHRQAAQAAPTVRVPALGPAPARHLRVVRDPQDRRRALLSGSFEQVCAELDRLAEIERQTESTQPTWRRIDA